MNVLSLFDGMSCGQIALQNLGISASNYFASEIDKHAIKVSSTKFPNTQHLGSVTEVQPWNLPQIDLLIGGSPCQGFSFAGKQLNFNDPRSALFFEFVRLLRQCQPKYFFLENVMMKKEYQDVISEHLGVQPVKINSNLVSAQNRKRLYWTNIPGVTQPEDRGILLRDILQDGVDEKYYLSDKMLNYLNTEKGGRPKDTNGKASCFTAGGNSGGLHSQMDLIEQQLEPRGDGKTNSLTTVQKDNLVQEIVSVAKSINGRIGGFNITERGVRFHQGDIRSSGISELGTIGFTDCKTDTITASHQQKVFETLNPRQLANYKNDDEKANTFLSTSYKGSQANGMTLTGNSRIRRLTPIEVCRLQTVPDNYFFHEGKQIVSDTQIYRMIGNGWTVAVIEHIFKGLL